MQIISIPFAIASIISVFLFYLFRPKHQIGFLVILSYCFIVSYNLNLLVYVLVFSLINYIFGLKIPSSKNRIVLFRIGIGINLVQLVLLKYASFAVDPFFQIFGSDIQVSRLSEIIIPLGISFFTLQGIGYLVNIKMGWEVPERKLLNFMLYIMFFPKFLSGPIERSNHFLPQLKAPKTLIENQVILGLKIALTGFFKKVVIANQLGIVVTSAYTNIDAIGGINFWLVILIQPLHLYFDFSGYTDIAIGLSKAYGIDILPNFNKPFLSENVTTLWKRFHMSLSFWFNDYVFKQLSFKYRKWGKNAAVFSVFITFTLFGIWHGAGWNFMILGFVQALAINYEFFTKKTRVKLFMKIQDNYRIWIGRVSTYLFFGISLIFFFSPDIDTAFRFFTRIANTDIPFQQQLFTAPVLIAVFFSVIFLLVEIINNDFKFCYAKIIKIWSDYKFLRILVYYAAIVLIISQLRGNSSFIYQMF